MFGNDCSIGKCDSLDCGDNGEILSAFGDYCTCDCDPGYSGSLCENRFPTEIGDPCEEIGLDCTETGQICDTVTLTCQCDTDNGYVLDEFKPSLSYGKCVGKVQSCLLDTDCFSDQVCEAGWCLCQPGAGDLCLKAEYLNFTNQFLLLTPTLAGGLCLNHLD